MALEDLPRDHFVVFANDKAEGGAAIRAAVRERHRAYLRAANAHGVETILGGPLLDEEGQMNGTLLVLRAPNVEAVERFLANDPYKLAGLFERVEVRAWNWSLGQPSADGR